MSGLEEGPQKEQVGWKGQVWRSTRPVRGSGELRASASGHAGLQVGGVAVRR